MLDSFDRVAMRHFFGEDLPSEEYMTTYLYLAGWKSRTYEDRTVWTHETLTDGVPGGFIRTGSAYVYALVTLKLDHATWWKEIGTLRVE